VAKDPYDLQALIEYYSLCKGKEKEKAGKLILRHPSVMQSWTVFKQVAKKEPGLLKLALKLDPPEPFVIQMPAQIDMRSSPSDEPVE